MSFVLVNAEVDSAQYLALRDRLKGIRGGFAMAMQGAISETLVGYRARTARRIGEEVRLKIGDIKRTCSLKPPSLRKLSGTLSVSKDKSVYLTQYMGTAARHKLLDRFLSQGQYLANAPRTKKGKLRKRPALKVKVRRKGALPQYPEQIPRAFVGVTGNNAHVGVFQRTGIKRRMRSGRYQGRLREVIRRLKGPAPLGVFEHAKGEGAATILAETMLGMEADVYARAASKVDWLLAKGVPPKLAALAERLNLD